MQKIILLGPNTSTQILEYYFKLENSPYEISAYTSDKEYIKENNYNGKPVVDFNNLEKLYPPDEYKIAIFMGYKHLNKIREERYKQAKAKGYKFISYVSKDSLCYTENIGENVFILPNTNIQPFAKIGNNVIIWSDTTIGHHVQIDDNCFLSSPRIAGFSKIGENCFLGTNCMIADHLTIGAFSIIGIGSVVTKNIKKGTVLAVKQTPKLPMTSFELEDILE